MTKEPDYINHEGVIVHIDIPFISVEILNKSACASCHAKGACSLGDVKAKMVEIENTGPDVYEPGERVNVKLKKTMGFKALWFSYVIPLIILMLLLVSLSWLGVSEPLTGLAIIAAIAFYYFVIWLIKDKLKKEFVFTIEKLK